MTMLLELESDCLSIASRIRLAWRRQRLRLNSNCIGALFYHAQVTSIGWSSTLGIALHALLKVVASFNPCDSACVGSKPCNPSTSGLKGPSSSMNASSSLSGSESTDSGPELSESAGS